MSNNSIRKNVPFEFFEKKKQHGQGVYFFKKTLSYIVHELLNRFNFMHIKYDKNTRHYPYPI